MMLDVVFNVFGIDEKFEIECDKRASKFFAKHRFDSLRDTHVFHVRGIGDLDFDIRTSVELRQMFNEREISSQVHCKT